jgi:hypothetical protein
VDSDTAGSRQLVLLIPIPPLAGEASWCVPNTGTGEVYVSVVSRDAAGACVQGHDTQGYASRRGRPNPLCAPSGSGLRSAPSTKWGLGERWRRGHGFGGKCRVRVGAWVKAQHLGQIRTLDANDMSDLVLYRPPKPLSPGRVGSPFPVGARCAAVPVPFRVLVLAFSEEDQLG